MMEGKSRVIKYSAINIDIEKETLLNKMRK